MMKYGIKRLFSLIQDESKSCILGCGGASLNSIDVSVHTRH